VSTGERAKFPLPPRVPREESDIMVTRPTTTVSLAQVTLRADAQPAERTAALELARLTGGTVHSARTPAEGRGVVVTLPAAGWPAAQGPADQAEAWMWLRIAPDGTGEIVASHGSFLYAAVRLLATQPHECTSERLAAGLFLPATFPWHRPLFDATLTQSWRSIRHFEPERYVAAIAEAGLTHLEVNALQAHMPYEDLTAWEYYPQFYTYCPGFNHFVDTPLTQGLWPAMYLDANLNRLRHLAELARQYGLKPGLCMFEPRSMPERFFTKYPTLRGARVDHPFRSRLPRYTMTQDHPIVKRHYAESLQKLLRAVPDLSYMSVWTNDSGAGFEHTASLYVGRNGGPYMIREWRNHEKVAEAAGQSIVRYLRNLQQAAAVVNPDFDVILRLEPFKVEHEHVKAGMGNHVTWEGPSLLVKGYSLPYPHPKYPENMGVAGSIMHSWMDPTEKEALRQSRAQGVEPAIHYSASGVFNHEPLLGLPFPRLVHAKLMALRDTGVRRVSCYGGLANPERTPYWPNPVAIRAAQFFPDKPIEVALQEFAEQLVGADHATVLTEAWRDFEEALLWQPLVGLYCAFGFCWQRTWDRPFVPDLEAVPAAEREYYERHGCFQHNNPSLADLGKDVLFDLITRESGAKMAADMDREVLPRVRAVLQRLMSTEAATTGTSHAVFVDLRDRVRAYQHWVTSLRNVCAWCDSVYGYLGTTDRAVRATCEKTLQAAIDSELDNARGLLGLLETTSVDVVALSGVADNTFIYGENLPELLRTKIRLTEKYRHHPPRIDPEIYWRAVPGTHWPAGWQG
jgi:hypothetical protein